MKQALEDIVQLLDNNKIEPSFTDVADLLWLYSVMGGEAKTSKVNGDEESEEQEKSQSEKLDKTRDREQEESTQDTKADDRTPLHSKNNNQNSTSKGDYFKAPTRKQFNQFNQFATVLKILKQFSNSSSTYEFNENETIEYIANTNIWNIQTTPQKELKYTLFIIIEKSISMRIWEEITREFVSALSRFSFFKDVKVVYLKEQDEEYQLYRDKYCKKKTSSKLFNSQTQRTLTILLSDCISKGWQDKRGYNFLDEVTAVTPFLIINMLPQRVWNRTMVNESWRVKFTHREGWKNEDLVSDVDYEEDIDDILEEHIRVPMTTLEKIPLRHWSNLIAGYKNNWVHGSLFEAEVFKIDIPKASNTKPSSNNISSEQQVKNFYAYASPLAHELAIYFSAVDGLSMEIMKMIQKTSLPKTNHTHLAEVFLSGLLKRGESKTKFNDDTYRFQDGVKEVLAKRLTPQLKENIQESNSEFIKEHLGKLQDFQAVIENEDSVDGVSIEGSGEGFASVDNSDSKVAKEKTIIKPALYKTVTEKIQVSPARTVWKKTTSDDPDFKEKTELVEIPAEYKMVTKKVMVHPEEKEEVKVEDKNKIILYKDTTLKEIDLSKIVNYLNKICTYLTFKVGKESFELNEKVVNKATSYKNLNSAINQEIEGSLGSFFFTKKPYNNNYFFDGNINLMIVSFSGWSSLSSLPYSNAIAYFVAEILSLNLSSYQHRNESIGCLYDYLSNKSDIDKNMREAYICKDCYNRIEDNKSDINMKVLKDIESILEVVGSNSKSNLDILNKNLTSLPPINTNFIGREAELKEIEKNLSSDNVVCVVNGIGGVGKSELSYQYLHKNKDKYNKIAFIEFTGESRSLEETFYFKFQDTLQLTKKDTLNTILKKLQGLAPKNLMVLDNLQTNEDFNKIKSLATNFDLLITTRAKLDSPNILNLESLNNGDMKELFLSIYPTDEDIDDILIYLDNHPLFIKLIAYSLKRKFTRLSYLREDIRDGKIAKINSKDKKTFQEHLYNTFDRQFKNEQNNELKEILQILALFPAIEIEFEMLKQVIGDKKLKLKLQKLVARGWLSKKDNSYKLHQIIKTFILTSYPAEYEDISFVLENIGNYINPADRTLIANQLSDYIPIIDSLLTLFGDRKDDYIASILDSNTYLYYSLGDYNNSLKMQEKSLSIREELLGENHPDTASSYNNLALLYKSKGDYDKAEPLYEKALKIREEVLGENHPNTATSYNDLAGLYRSKDDYDKAEPLYEKALKIWEEVLGENHPDTATSYNNLAGLYESKGDYDKAEPLYEKALKIREEVLGENHLDTATSYNTLALLYKSKGDYDKAEPLYEKALKIREEVLGENHPDTATSYHNLAGLYRSKGDYDKAEPLYEKALKIWEEILGEKHPNTATSYWNLALFYKARKKCNKAKELLEKCIMVVEHLEYPHISMIDLKKVLIEVEKNLKKEAKAKFNKKGRFCINEVEKKIEGKLMPKKINLIPHKTDKPIEKWHKKIREIKDNGVKLKMLVIEKIMSNPNISAKEVQDTFFISPRLMYQWIKEYNSMGLEGLTEKKLEGSGSGKGNLKVDDEVYEKLKEEMEKGNLKVDDEVYISLKEEMAKDPTRKWTGKEKQQYIKEKFNIEVTQTGIAYRLKRL